MDLAKPNFSGEGWASELNDLMGEGDKVTYTMGQESFAPVSYNSFTVGPFSATTTIRKGETGEDAYYRCFKYLIQVFEVEFKLKKKMYFEHLGESGERE